MISTFGYSYSQIGVFIYIHINIQVTKITINIDVKDELLKMAVSGADTVTGLSSFRSINTAPWPGCFMASNVIIKPIIRNVVLKGFEHGCTNHSIQVDHLVWWPLCQSTARDFLRVTLLMS